MVTVTGPCPACGADAPITSATCSACQTLLHPRLEPATGTRRRLPGLLWCGLLPPVVMIVIVQVVAGLVVGLNGIAPSIVDGRRGSTLSLVAHSLPVLLVGMGAALVFAIGPAIVAAGQISAYERRQSVLGRFRWVAACAVPLSLITAVPILGVVPAMLAADPHGRHPGEARDLRKAICPGCDYALPEAHELARVRCPECGGEVRWAFLQSVLSRDHWLGALVGAVGLVLLPLAILLFDVRLVGRSAWLVVAIGTIIGGFVLVRLRGGWSHRSWRRPSVGWAFFAVAPFLVAVIAGLVGGLR